MIALPDHGFQRPAWRVSRQLWSDEAVMLAKVYAAEGLNAFQVSRSLESHGVSVPPRTIGDWLYPRPKRRRK